MTPWYSDQFNTEALGHITQANAPEPKPDDYVDHINDVLDGEEDREDLEAEMNCSMGPDGQCGQAGSEYCDLDCPYRDAP